MKKLEDIPKKQIFEVPDGYFEKLPGIIQSRVATQDKPVFSPFRSVALRYALGIMITAVAAFFWINQPSREMSAESILASIETTDLVAYINSSDITTDELLEDLTLNSEDASEIEGAVYSLELDDTALDQIMNEID